MKTIHKTVILVAIGLLSLYTTNAQNTIESDTTLNRQILLEKEFNPSLQDASKINTLPSVHEPEVKQVSIEYETSQPNISFSNFPVGDTGAGDIMTQIDYNKKRGYLNLAGGNYMNLRGSFGYRIIDSATDKLDFFARHNSTNGDIDYSNKNYNLKKAKAKYMDNLFKAQYSHSFEFFTWQLSGSFENTSYNYYGNPFDMPIYFTNGELNYHAFDFDSRQVINNFGVETSIRSNDNNEFIYSGNVRYNHFTTKYGAFYYESKGVNGNLLDADFDMSAPFGSDKYVGIRLGIMNESFSNVYEVLEDYYHSLTSFAFTPYFKFDGGEYTADLGIKVNYAIDKKNKFTIAPDVKLSWQFADRSNLYLNATGGINTNNYLSILQENRYIAPWQKVNYSHTLIDGTIGIKSGIVTGLEFDIFAGYKQTNDEHLYITSTYTGRWSNVSMVEYYDVGTGKIGGILKTSLIPYTDLSATITGYFYDVTGDDYPGGTRLYEAWNLPTFTLNLNADINPIDKLTVSMAYNLITGRKIPFPIYNEIRKMKNISELNFRGNYQINESISVNASLNNVLNQKYDIWYGYTQQGFNVLGGISLKF